MCIYKPTQTTELWLCQQDHQRSQCGRGEGVDHCSTFSPLPKPAPGKMPTVSTSLTAPLGNILSSYFQPLHFKSLPCVLDGRLVLKNGCLGTSPGREGALRKLHTARGPEKWKAWLRGLQVRPAHRSCLHSSIRWPCTATAVHW